MNSNIPITLQSSFRWFLLLCAVIGANTRAEEVALSDVEVKYIRDPEWISYKLAYKAMRLLEEYKKPKNFLSIKFRLTPTTETQNLQDLQLKLIGDTINLNIPINNLWGHIPMNTVALNDDAELVLNRQAGAFKFSRVFSIVVNESGAYPVSELRIACQQALDFYKDIGVLYKMEMHGKRCMGVKFIYPPAYEGAAAHIVGSNKKITALSETSREIVNKYVIYRFKDSDVDDQLVTDAPIVAITSVVE